MRHFAANPSKSLNGFLCGGIFGFLKNIKHLCEKFTPEKVIVVWEGGGSIRRRNIDKSYKEGRRPVSLNRNYYSDIPETKENRNYQLKIIIEILKLTPVNQIFVNDCEADDIIAYLCKTRNLKENKIIVTSDKDYYQLIDEKVKIWSPNKKKIIDEEEVLKTWGVHPKNFCTVRCFAGDQSDGIKGAKGVGFKKLVKNFPDLSYNKFISVNDIIDMSNNKIKSGEKLKLYSAIADVKSEANKNWKLMYLDSSMLNYCQVKSINYQFENKESSLNKFGLLKILNREGLNSFDIHSFCMIIKNIK